ncbi:MAG: hypothetical protein HF312_05940 [Ignavibacteria bacterium]|nr:hypothetical protein [Ignavibacteria bacterium]MCU7519740.1 hypothetical protein [Ignavibacteria bacterium]
MTSKIKFLLVLALSSLSIIITSCEKKEAPKPVVSVVTPDSAKKIDRKFAEERVRQILGTKVSFFEEGKFQEDSSPGIAAGTEKNGKTEWGIKFFYFKKANNDLSKTFETPLLKGSFTESLIKKIKLGNADYEMIYYDSQAYFMGSGGGEIFNYIVDFNKNQVYYAHFFSVEKKPTSLYLSPNTNVKEIRDFFIRHFQRDYPELRIVEKDYNLEDIF